MHDISLINTGRAINTPRTNSKTTKLTEQRSMFMAAAQTESTWHRVTCIIDNVE